MRDRCQTRIDQDEFAIKTSVGNPPMNLLRDGANAEVLQLICN